MQKSLENVDNINIKSNAQQLRTFGVTFFYFEVFSNPLIVSTKLLTRGVLDFNNKIKF